MEIMVTGGLGFIGSHLTERLMKKGHRVVVVDNLSSGSLSNLQDLIHDPCLRIVKEDLKKPATLDKVVKDCELVFHLAANPDVKLGETDPQIHFAENNSWQPLTCSKHSGVRQGPRQ